MYEGDGSNVYPIRTHFTVPTKKYWFDLGMMPTAYVTDNLYGESPFVANTGSEYAYTLNPTGNEIVARDLSENCNKCSKQSEISGVPEESCKILVHEEVHFFEYDNTNPANLYDSSNPYKDLLFATGGYVRFDLTNIGYTTSTDPQKDIDKKVSFHGMPIVPSTFYAKDVQGIYLNNWLYNQYQAATATFTD